MKMSIFSMVLSLCMMGGIPGFVLADAPMPGERAKVDGEQVVKDLQARFDNVVDACADGTPAYRCSGVIVRGAMRNESESVWEPDGKDLQLEKLSMTYQRADTPPVPSKYGTGMIFQLPQSTRQGVTPLEVWCAYPVGGSTDGLQEHGCVTDASYGRRCEDIQVETAQQWIDYYDPGTKRCSFNMKIAEKATSRFSAFTEAAAHFDELNELTVQPWKPCQPDSIPLQAFYYVSSSDASFEKRHLDEARLNQQDFFLATREHLVLPVIRIGRANTTEKTYSYRPEDQSVLPPVSKAIGAPRCTPPRANGESRRHRNPPAP